MRPERQRRGIHILLIVFLLLAVSGFAQSPAIDYAVTIHNPISHIYDVDLQLHGMRTTTVDVAMPAWEPGNYRIQDFARNVQDFRATDSREQPLQWTQTDKQTWHISKPAAADVIVHYQVFSRNLTDEMADISGPSLYMYVVGGKQNPVEVRYNVPAGWQVYTALEKRGDTYYGPNYDVFVDAPAFIGNHFKVLNFEVANVPHRMVFSQAGIPMIDAQVTSDVTQVVQAASAIFGGKLPYRDYTFLIKVQPATGSGGLEHLNSTRITVGDSDFVNETSYHRFLFVVAHEFFHLWNVKRIRPQVLGPFDYSKEANTRLLWVSEGITSYYADLILSRSEIATPQEFYDKIGSVIDKLQHSPGRLLTSAEESSWNSWLRSDNADNNSISYYDKGEILGFLLDLEIRSRTHNTRSLDDVMRYLLANYADKGIGMPEDAFLKAVEAVAGSDFKEFFQMNVQGRNDLDYDRYLKLAGLQISIARQPGTIYVGIEYERNDADMPRVKRVLPGSPAEQAGVDNGDVLVAMDDQRLTYENFRIRLHSHKLGETIKLNLTRGERMLATQITPIEYQQQTWTVAESPQPTAEQNKLRNSLLGVKEH